MKKTGLFRILIFTIIGMLVLSWLIPASTFENGELVKYGVTAKLGFFDFFTSIFNSFKFQYFLEVALFILSVGAFYGVLSKTGKYRAWIEKIASSFKGIEYVFLICVATVLAVLSSVFNYGLLLFIFIPLLIGIILAMGYNKIVAFATTFGAILIGQLGTTIGYDINGVLNELIGIKIVNGLVFKLLLLLIPLGLLIFYLVKSRHSNLKKVEDKIEDTIENGLFIGEKSSNKYSVVSIIIIFSVLFILLVLGCTKWVDGFQVELFKNMHTAIMDFSIKDFKIFENIIGTVNEFGAWGYIEMSIMLLLSSLLIGRLFRMKHVSIIDNMCKGAIKLVPVTTLVIISYSVLYITAGSYCYPTIANFILNATSKFNLFFSAIATAIGSALHIDMTFVAIYVAPQIAAQDANATVLMLLIQSIYGFVMLVAPTSIILILGLGYLDIPYKEWIKKMWKNLLILLAIIFVILFIAMLKRPISLFFKNNWLYVLIGVVIIVAVIVTLLILKKKKRK